METYSKCTAEEFKRDISELCPVCPHTKAITDRVKGFIKRMEAQSEVLPEDMFKDLLKTERLSLSKTMGSFKAYDLQKGSLGYPDGTYLHINTFNYICAKEMQRALIVFNQSANPTQGNPPRKQNELIKPLIALLCHYNNQEITRANALDIAKQYGHEKAGRLYQDFKKYSSHANRVGTRELSEKRLINKKTLFAKVIEHLDGKAKLKAIDDLALINSNS